MGLAMIKQAFKRLWNDKRGNALIIAGAAMPLVVGSAGLASDTIQWTMMKRQLQRAADSAAIAGVYARLQNQTVLAAVTRDLTHNYRVRTPQDASFPSISQPANTSVYTNAVEVTLQITLPLTFTSMFVSTPLVIPSSRTAPRRA